MLGVSARGRMVHRAELERDASQGLSANKDAYGGPLAENWQQLGRPVPCFAWTTRRFETVGVEKTSVVEEIHIMLPPATEITERDRVAQVKDRLGVVLFPGPYNFRGVRRKEGFIAAELQGVTA